MIRRSATIAAVAFAVSLLLHASGLSWMSRNLPNESAGAVEAVDGALSTAFEDIAEALYEPVPPETAPTPERPVEVPPKSTREIQPTSRALVASENPQDVLSPDTGSAMVPQPDTIRPAALGEIKGGDTSADTNLVSPDVTDNVAGSPNGTTNAGTASVEATLADPAPSPKLTSAPGPEAPKYAALSQPTATSAIPVLPSPTPSSAPIIQAEPDATGSESLETKIAPAVDELDATAADDDASGSALAVLASPRPQPAAHRTSETSTGSAGNGSPNSQFGLSALSPDQRRRADQASLGFGGEITDGIALLQSRRTGNSDTTNFAGRVLVHLNRTPATDVSIRGTAQVAFEINVDGTLAWVDVTVSSGSMALDNAAVKQVRKASPFPRPPTGSRRTFSFVYRGT